MTWDPEILIVVTLEIIWKIFQDPKRKLPIIVEEAKASDSSDEIVQFARQ